MESFSKNKLLNPHRRTAGLILIFLIETFSAFAQTELGTLEPHKFYFYPDSVNELNWKVISGTLNAGDLDYEIIDFYGTKVGDGTAITSDSIHITTTVNLPRGYHIIRFPNLGTQFGLSVLPYK
ncbi:MAG: hypothetical protein ACOCZL_04930, partial [Bacteroidota bacterium]